MRSMSKRKIPDRSKIFKDAMSPRKGKPFRRRIPAGGSSPSSRWISLLLWSAFGLVGGYILFFSPLLRIQEVSVEGTSIISTDEYQMVAETEMTGAYLGWLSKRNFFLVPVTAIERTLLERFPLLSRLTVERRFPDRITLRLTENPVMLCWCAGGPCYGVRDGRAVVIGQVDESRYATVKLSVIDGSAVPVEVGDFLPVDQYLETFQAVHAQLPKIVTGTVGREAVTPSRHSGELTLFLDEGWRLTLSVERPPEESLGMLKIFLDEYVRGGKERSQLASVDLRVEGKVFYVERDGLSGEAGIPIADNLKDRAVNPIVQKKKKE